MTLHRVGRDPSAKFAMKMRLAQSPGLARTERVFVRALDSTNKQKISGCCHDVGVQVLNRRWTACHLRKSPLHRFRDSCHMVTNRPS